MIVNILNWTLIRMLHNRIILLLLLHLVALKLPFVKMPPIVLRPVIAIVNKPTEHMIVAA